MTRRTASLLAAGVFLFTSGVMAQETAGTFTREQVREAVLPVLESGLAGSGVQLLDVKVEGDRVTLDLSKNVLTLGQGRALDEAVRRLAGAVAAAPADVNFFRFSVTAEGAPLRQAKSVPVSSAPLARRAALLAAQGRKMSSNAPTASVVVLNPVLDGSDAEGARAAELAMSLRETLSGAGLEVLSTRNLDKDAGLGASGSAKWLESASAYLEELGAPADLLANGDYLSRPLFANWAGADILLTLRSSGAGVPVIFYSSDSAAAADSRAYAAAAQARLSGAKLVDCDDCAVELRLAEMPSVVVDLGLAGTDSLVQLAAASSLRETVKPMAATSSASATAVQGATMAAPAPGSTLSGASVTFQWNTVSNATNYWLMVGTYLGGNNLFGEDQGTLSSATVSGLPTDGRTLYVRLWSYIDSNWVSNDYTYKAFAPAGVTPTKAQITAPAAGSKFSTSPVIFTWDAGVAVSRYYLFVGLWQGGNTLFSQDMGTAQTASVSGIPTDGSTIHARLWSYIDGVWQYNDYTYTANGTTTPVKAAMASPAAGSKLAGTSVTSTRATAARPMSPACPTTPPRSTSASGATSIAPGSTTTTPTRPRAPRPPAPRPPSPAPPPAPP